MSSDRCGKTSIGLANRLLTEKVYPQARRALERRTPSHLVLKKNGVLGATPVTGRGLYSSRFQGSGGLLDGLFGALQVILYNSSLVQEVEAPKSILDLADPSGKIRW